MTHIAADDLLSDLRGLFAAEADPVANAANAAAAIWQHVADINWAGFYFLKGGELVLGPFQGKPACVRIPLGRGVCGTAAARREMMVVTDVHAFPGHIACDAASASEIVVPLLRDGALLGVLDIDSPTPGRFGAPERALFEAVARAWTQSLAQPEGGLCYPDGMAAPLHLLDDEDEAAAEARALAAAIAVSDADLRTVSHERVRLWLLRLANGEFDAPPPEPD